MFTGEKGVRQSDPAAQRTVARRGLDCHRNSAVPFRSSGLHTGRKQVGVSAQHGDAAIPGGN